MKQIDEMKRTKVGGLQATYLGDGAYAYFDGYSIIVTAENGIEATEEVFLEPECFAKLLRFASKFYNNLDKHIERNHG